MQLGVLALAPEACKRACLHLDKMFFAIHADFIKTHCFQYYQESIIFYRQAGNSESRATTGEGNRWISNYGKSPEKVEA